MTKNNYKILKTVTINNNQKKSNNHRSFFAFSKKKIIFLSLSLLLIISLILVPKDYYKSSIRKILAMVGIYTEEIKKVEIESNNYDNPGSYKITKEANWISQNKANITITIDSIKNTNDTNHKDIILLLDNSESMNAEKLNKVKSASINLINYILQDNESRVLLTTFNGASEKLSGFTNNSNELVELINSIHTGVGTNYKVAYDLLLNIMNSYQRRSNTDLVVLFITDGYPTADTPSEVSIYTALKDNYSYMDIVGIQYEMGNSIASVLDNITDRVFVADKTNINNILKDVVREPIKYNSFLIEESIDDNYFQNISNVTSSNGTTSINENKITWNLDSLLTGTKSVLTFDIELKEDYQSTKQFVPTSKGIIVTNDNDISNSSTTVLKTRYDLSYNTNTPSECSIENINSSDYPYLATVNIPNDELNCPGYIFKGWTINNDNVKINNSTSFLMPSNDVEVMGTWTKQSISKSMSGEVNTHATLYKVLEEEKEKGSGFVREYTNEHQDSIDSSLSTKKIYYWYTPGNKPSEIKKRFNVIFAGYCWQMIRTTDTGGVKMLYNGKAVDGKCLENRGEGFEGYGKRQNIDLSSSYYYGTTYTFDKELNQFKLDGDALLDTWSDSTYQNLVNKYTCRSSNSNATCSTLYYVSGYSSNTMGVGYPIEGNYNYAIIGALPFNASTHSLASSGYMYNKVYSGTNTNQSSSKSLLSSAALGTTYWYGDDISYDATTGKYSLVNPFSISSTDDYPNLVGKYTFQSTNQNYTASTVKYIAAINDVNMLYIQLSSGNNLSYYNTPYTFGSDYIDNGDGTYTLENPITINISDWPNNYSSLNYKYYCTNAVNNTCSSLKYTVSTSITALSALSDTNNYLYSNSFTYENGNYYLSDDKTAIWNFSKEYEPMSSKHYTCLNETGECTSIKYVYRTSNNIIYYLNINDGKSIEDIINEMIYSENVNKTSSEIKVAIDNWYEQHLLSYDDFIEDTIYCQSRYITSLGGFDPNGGSVRSDLTFKYNNPLKCSSELDSYSINNDKAKLKYKIGLLTYYEGDLVNNINVRIPSPIYWYSSPMKFDGTKGLYYYTLGAGGYRFERLINNNYGIRPAISLVPDIEYAYGTGTMDNPYVIDLER